MSAKRRNVQKKHIQEKTGKSYRGERSPYWEYFFNSSSRSNVVDAENRDELAEANPDVLPEEQTLWPARTTEFLDRRKAMLEAIRTAKLSAAEKKVVSALGEGRSLTEIAGFCKSSLSSVRVHLRRAGEKIRKRYVTLREK